MHRSILTFGLLASSLVMLGIIPLFNQHNFPNVNAQEYDKYRDSSYSQYPTDDNKYQCRTGPVEGFFVSSVEFCKHNKFDGKDDRKDNRDNRTGHKAHLALKVHQDHKVLLVLPEQQEQQVHKAFKV